YSWHSDPLAAAGYPPAGPPPGAAGRLCGHAGGQLARRRCRDDRLAVPLSAGGRHSGQWHSAAAAAAGIALGYAGLKLYPEPPPPPPSAACRLLNGDARRH
ncbi:hypothetical protein K6U28_19545, partial [Vibrio parahaemolyticus]|nr:hypothetical protein [Vibrio parahaemolyticus]